MPAVNTSAQLRAAIQAVTSADPIITLNGSTAGQYSVLTLAQRSSTKPPPSRYNGYTIEGTSGDLASSAKLLDTRIYQQNVDGAFAPGVVKNLTLRYASLGAVDGGALLSVTSTAARSITLENVLITGAHRGWNGNGNLYMSLRSFNAGAPLNTSLTLTGVTVDITGQGNSFNGNTGGSAFLHIWNNNGAVSIADSIFDESGYASSFNFLSANITITGNQFIRTATASQVIRPAGEILARVTGTVTNNEFNDGAYLDLRNLNLSSSTLAISGNTFSLLQGGYGIIVRDGQTTANLANLVIQGSSFDGGLAVVNEISTPGSVLSFATATNDVNDITFASLQVGGAGVDSVTGTDGTDWISGGDGADILTGDATIGDSSFDAFVFAKVGTTDKITDYSGTGGDGDQIWLDDAVFTGLTTVAGPTTFLQQLASSDYGTDFVSGKHIIYNGNALWYDADGVAGGEVKITDFDPAASPAPLASDILIF